MVDRDTASRLGLTQQVIDDTLYDAFGQRQVSTMYTPLNQYHVVMEAAPQYWQNPASLAEIDARSTSNGEVPLSAFTHFEPSTTALSVNHQGQFPGRNGVLQSGARRLSGQAVAAYRDGAAQMGLPSSIHGSFAGTAQAFQDSLANEPVLDSGSAVSPYISCWGFCTRATFTRSRFCQRCRQLVSERYWR